MKALLFRPKCLFHICRPFPTCCISSNRYDSPKIQRTCKHEVKSSLLYFQDDGRRLSRVGFLEFRRKKFSEALGTQTIGNADSSSSEYSHTVPWQRFKRQKPFGSRHIWIVPPVQMGRRSSKIAMRKGAQDLRKSKLYARIGKRIVSAVRQGGPNPSTNSALAALMQLARDSNVPKDIIDRNIKKATEKGQQNFVDSTYEVYAFGGVGLVLEVLTDNNNRAAATIRDVVKKSGGKMADPGSVLFNFKRAGVLNVKASEIDGDELLLAATEAGAEDVLEPPVYEDEDEQEGEIKYFKVITSVEEYAAVSLRLREKGVSVDMDHSGLELIPLAPIEVDDEAVDLNKSLIEKLLELDDVDAVYSNQR